MAGGRRLTFDSESFWAVGGVALVLLVMPVEEPVYGQDFDPPQLTGIVGTGTESILVTWRMDDFGDLVGIRVQRQEPEMTRDLPRDQTQYLDSGLQPSTSYTYRVCALYALSGEEEPHEECSDWHNGRTLDRSPDPPPDPRPPPLLTQYSVGPDFIVVGWISRFPRLHIRWEAKQGTGFSGREAQVEINPDAWEGTRRFGPLQPRTNYLFKGQSCTINVVGVANCGPWSDPPLEVRTTAFPPPAPSVTAVSGAASVTLHFTYAQDVQVVEIVRDEQVILTHQTWSHYLNRYVDRPLRANTAHAYSVCVKNEVARICSQPVTGIPLAARPTQPMNLTVRKRPLTSTRPGDGAGSAEITGYEIVFQWQNAPSHFYIPGVYVTFERGTPVPDASGRLETVWHEIGRISSDGDPTAHSVAQAREWDAQGNRYRACALVLNMGEQGKACSDTVRLR